MHRVKTNGLEMEPLVLRLIWMDYPFMNLQIHKKKHIFQQIFRIWRFVSTYIGTFVVRSHNGTIYGSGVSLVALEIISNCTLIPRAGNSLDIIFLWNANIKKLSKVTIVTELG